MEYPEPHANPTSLLYAQLQFLDPAEEPFHAASPVVSLSSSRFAWTSAKLRSASSSLTCPPVRFCQRSTITSTYFGSSSSPQHTRPVDSAATRVVPLPRNGSYTSSPRLR